MSEIADRYRRVSAAFTEKLTAVPEDRWESPTPCEDWNARDLVRHVVDTQGMFLGLVGRDVGDLPSFDDDPRRAWAAARDRIQADLDHPERATEAYDGYFGRTTFEESVDRFLSFDQVVHGWDLARATGQDERIDSDEVRRLAADVEAFGEALHSPGACGAAIEAPADADDQTKLLMSIGRRP